MNKDSLAVPISIVIAAGLIAGAIYMNGGKVAAPAVTDQNNQQEQTAEIIPVTEADHIYGNPNADIMIVEYSDFDCPFCTQFHGTMEQIMAEYGPGGKVAWVFRHFPIVQRHPNAPKLAEASECVAELAGNDAFWKFANQVFDKATDEFTDMTKVSEFAVTAGVKEKAAFETCLASGKYTKKVNDQLVEAQKSGGRGTPFPIIIAGDQSAALPGAVPYDQVKQALDSLIAQTEGKS